MLTSLPTTKNGTVGMRRCISRSTWLSTMPLPVPASNSRNAVAQRHDVGDLATDARRDLGLLAGRHHEQQVLLAVVEEPEGLALVERRQISLLRLRCRPLQPPFRLAEPYPQFASPNITQVRGWRTPRRAELSAMRDEPMPSAYLSSRSRSTESR